MVICAVTRRPYCKLPLDCKALKLLTYFSTIYSYHSIFPITTAAHSPKDLSDPESKYILLALSTEATTLILRHDWPTFDNSRRTAELSAKLQQCQPSPQSIEPFYCNVFLLSPRLLNPRSLGFQMVLAMTRSLARCEDSCSDTFRNQELQMELQRRKPLYTKNQTQPFSS